MIEFLDRMAGRGRGTVPVVQPLLPSRHAPDTMHPANHRRPMTAPQPPAEIDRLEDPESEAASRAREVVDLAAQTRQQAQVQPVRRVAPPLPRDAGSVHQRDADGATDGDADDEGPPPAPDRREQLPVQTATASPEPRRTVAVRRTGSVAELVNALAQAVAGAGDGVAPRNEPPSPAPPTQPAQQQPVPGRPGERVSVLNDQSVPASDGAARMDDATTVTIQPVSPRAGVRQPLADDSPRTPTSLERSKTLEVRPLPFPTPDAAVLPFAPRGAPTGELAHEDHETTALPVRSLAVFRANAPAPRTGSVLNEGQRGPSAVGQQAPPTPLPVRVTIGRIEVRAVQPAAPPAAAPQPGSAELPLALDAYLKQRSGGQA